MRSLTVKQYFQTTRAVRVIGLCAAAAARRRPRLLPCGCGRGLDGAECGWSLGARSDLRDARLGVAGEGELGFVSLAVHIHHNDVARVDLSEEDLLG